MTIDRQAGGVPLVRGHAGRVRSLLPRATRLKLDRKGMVGLAMLGAYVLVAILRPHVVRDPLRQDLIHRLAGPSTEHWIGTDALGRDVFSRLIAATRSDLRFG